MVDTWWKHGGSGVVTWIRMDANGRSKNSWFINDVAADGTIRIYPLLQTNATKVTGCWWIWRLLDTQK